MGDNCLRKARFLEMETAPLPSQQLDHSSQGRVFPIGIPFCQNAEELCPLSVLSGRPINEVLFGNLRVIAGVRNTVVDELPESGDDGMRSIADSQYERRGDARGFWA